MQKTHTYGSRLIGGVGKSLQADRRRNRASLTRRFSIHFLKKIKEIKKRAVNMSKSSPKFAKNGGKLGKNANEGWGVKNL